MYPCTHIPIPIPRHPSRNPNLCSFHGNDAGIYYFCSEPRYQVAVDTLLEDRPARARVTHDDIRLSHAKHVSSEFDKQRLGIHKNRVFIVDVFP